MAIAQMGRVLVALRLRASIANNAKLTITNILIVDIVPQLIRVRVLEAALHWDIAHAQLDMHNQTVHNVLLVSMVRHVFRVIATVEHARTVNLVMDPVHVLLVLPDHTAALHV
jgi:hypothetical protein